MIIKLDTSKMSITYEFENIDKLKSEDELMIDISTLISVLSAHQAFRTFTIEENQLLYLFILVQNSNQILKAVNKLSESLDDFDYGDDDADSSIIDDFREFLKDYLDSNNDDYDDYDDYNN